MLDVLLSAFTAEHFLDPEAARHRLSTACARHPETVCRVRIGESEQGRPIDAYRLGEGDISVSLIAGNHSDEPVGPDFLRRFVVAALDRIDAIRPMLDRYRFCIVPHTNPDGEYANRVWRGRWPDFRAYLALAFREEPGRDMEFGFPHVRVENSAVASWLRSEGPFHLHGSLHGMGVAEGALLLIDRRWGYRTAHLQERFWTAVREEDMPLHDQNRQGEKGFFYLGPGFWTTPDGEAMRAFFESKDDRATAVLFHDSSMEFVRSLGGDPLCYVTELPLFIVAKRKDAAVAYLDFKNLLPRLRLRLARGEPIDELVEPFGVRPLDLETALRLQLRTLSAALEEVAGVSLP